MKQVIIVHGGTTFSTYESYLNHLRNKRVKIERIIPSPSWKGNLQKELGEDYLVLCPSMPNATNANYDEWKIYFDRICDIITDDCILIGHSLGGIFLAKYLSENTIPKRIAATILIAAPFDDESEEDLTNFKLSRISELFQKQAGSVSFFNGNDDPVIPIVEQEKFRKELPNAEYITLSAPDHFVRPEFPELTRAIHNLE